MKCILSALLFSFSSLVFATDWKVVAESSSCSGKIEVLGREGEKYVIVNHGAHKRKLFSNDGSAYSDSSMQMIEFHSDTKNEKYLLGEPTYTFMLPSQVERNPPKIDVFYSGRKENCRMELK